MNIEIAKSLLSFIAPTEVIENFEFVSIKENPDHLILEFEEFDHLIPEKLKGRETKSNGFMNKLELHTFPQKGKSCYLHIKRRRWEDKSTGDNYSNHYDLYKEGMKSTHELGEFLKKNNRGQADKF